MSSIVRCDFDDCHRKLKLVQQLSGKCACNKVFCDHHRYSSKHNCNFNYVEHTKEYLIKHNPVIVASKINGEVQYR